MKCALARMRMRVRARTHTHTQTHTLSKREISSLVSTCGRHDRSCPDISIMRQHWHYKLARSVTTPSVLLQRHSEKGGPRIKYWVGLRMETNANKLVRKHFDHHLPNFKTGCSSSSTSTTAQPNPSLLRIILWGWTALLLLQKSVKTI